jgi:hypothetical protein
VIDYLTLADRSTTKYLELIGRGRYTPAVTTKQEIESGPVAMMAQITEQLTRNTKDGIRAAQGKQTNTKSGGQQQNKPSGSTGGDATTKASQHRTWMTKQGFPAGRHQGKRWKWLSTCTKWMLHHADKHDEWASSSKDRTKDKGKEGPTVAGSAGPPSTSAVRAHLAVLGSDLDDGDSVRTWTGIMI